MRYLFICLLMVLTPLAASSAVTTPYGSCSSGTQRIVAAGEAFKRIYVSDGDKLTSMWRGRDGNFYQARVIPEGPYAASIRRSAGARILDIASLRSNPPYFKDAAGNYFKLVPHEGNHGLVLRAVPLTGSELATVKASLGNCRPDGSSSSGGGSSSSGSDDPDEEPIDDDPVDDGPDHGGSDPICKITHSCGSTSSSSSSGGSTSSSSTSSSSTSSSSSSSGSTSSSSTSSSSTSSSSSSTSSSGANPRVGLSGLPWNSGSWVNGSNDRMERFEAYRNRPSDAVTQSIPNRYETWAGFAGASSEAQVNTEFAQSPSAFRPTFAGFFSDANWFRHVWGGSPATEHRQRIIHLAWMDPIPHSVGNGWGGGRYENPRVWQQIKDGSADKYAFLLGRKFAYLDAQNGDTRFPMTIDFAYEFTLLTHNQLPEGSYMDGATKRYAYQDFPYGWSRLVKAIKEGYKYQRGRDCPYRFSWRPQLRFIVDDRTSSSPHTIRHEEIFPNRVADWAPGASVIDGVTVIPAGPIGRMADLVGVSWHDSSKEMVRGSTAASGNWEAIYRGYPSHWGLQEVADFARAQGVHVVFPEWAARRASHPPASPNPGDVYRMTYEFFRRNASIMAYETVFDQGSGSLYNAWDPVQPPAQNPATVYKELFGR